MADREISIKKDIECDLNLDINNPSYLMPLPGAKSPAWNLSPSRFWVLCCLMKLPNERHRLYNHCISLLREISQIVHYGALLTYLDMSAPSNRPCRC